MNCDILKIVRGNDFATQMTITALDAGGNVIEDFSLEESTEVVVKYTLAGTSHTIEAYNYDIEGNDVTIQWSDLALGKYGFEIEGKFNGYSWRSAARFIFQIVADNASANIPDGVLVNGVYMLNNWLRLLSGTGGGGKQVQADWDETDTASPAYIQNKPTLAPVATSGSYNDLTDKPNIPAAQIQSDWDQTDTSAKDYIKNKPTIPSVTDKADKVSGAVAGDFAALDSNGNLTDSGKKASDFATAEQGAKADTAIQDISGKQDVLVSGTNIKTINNESILGSGNITIEGGGDVESVNGQTGVVVLDATDVGAYELPENGIPATDLASGIQTALNQVATNTSNIASNTTAIDGNTTDIANLQAAYAGLTQSDIVIGTLPASGVANTIYRVPSTSSYSDYMWNGSQFVLMATYDNAIDDVPTEGSNNLVKSGGVYAQIGIKVYKPDISAGLRNVSSTTGEFVSTTTANHYATEIELEEFMTSVSVSGGFAFTGSYGYAFVKSDGTFVSGAKTTSTSFTISNIQEKILAGATKLRISISSTGTISITPFLNVVERISRESERAKNVEKELADKLGDTYDSYTADTSAGLRNVSSTTGAFSTSNQPDHYATEFTLKGYETEISVKNGQTFSGNYGYAFLGSDNSFIDGLKTTSTDYTISNIQSLISQGAVKVRISLKSNGTIIALNDESFVDLLNNETQRAKSVENSLGERIGIPYNQFNADTSDGLRNVSSETGEFVSTSSEDHYANEFELPSNASAIIVENGNSFVGDYGYAFLTDENVLVNAKKTTETDYTVTGIQSLVSQGATKFRVSLKSSGIVKLQLEDVSLAEIVQQNSETVNEVIAELDEYKIKTRTRVFVGSPQIYLSGSTASEDVLTAGSETKLENAYSKYDELCLLHPDFFERAADIGMDESNTYPIRHYILRMQSPKISDNRNGSGTNLWSDTLYPYNRILLVGGVHASEIYAMTGLFLALKELLESSAEWAKFIKSNFVLDIIPLANPWGVANSAIYNVNNVNLNRDYNSLTPQAETIAMKNLISNLLTKGLVGIIDCHNTGIGDSYIVSSPNYTKYKVYALLTQQLNGAFFDANIEVFGEGSHLWLWNTSEIGQLHWYANKIGVLGCTCEVDETTAKKVGMAITKNFVINLINAFGCYTE